jgi:hypothetical protein
MRGAMAYTVRHEDTRASVSAEPQQYTPRVTQVYRREDGQRKVVHGHTDTLPSRREPEASRDKGVVSADEC